MKIDDNAFEQMLRRPWPLLPPQERRIDWLEVGQDRKSVV